MVWYCRTPWWVIDDLAAWGVPAHLMDLMLWQTGVYFLHKVHITCILNVFLLPFDNLARCLLCPASLSWTLSSAYCLRGTKQDRLRRVFEHYPGSCVVIQRRMERAFLPLTGTKTKTSSLSWAKPDQRKPTWKTTTPPVSRIKCILLKWYDPSILCLKDYMVKSMWTCFLISALTFLISLTVA